MREATQKYTGGYVRGLMENIITNAGKTTIVKGILVWGLIISALTLCKLLGYLVFHTFAELFCTAIAFSIFALSWNTRRYLQNNYLFIIGISYLFIGSLDTLHMLTYGAMKIVQVNSGVTVEIWVANRYIESFSLLIAPLLLHVQRIRTFIVFSAYLIVTLLIFSSIFVWNNFPVCYVDGVGLTAFKKNSEYIVSCILVLSIILLFKKRRFFDKDVLILTAMSLSLAILTGLCFTLYIGLYDTMNMIGHFLKVFSYYFMYKAIIVTGMNRPFDLLFRNLKISEDSLQKINAELEQRVTNRTILLEQEIKARIYIEARLARLNRVYAVVSETTHLIVHAADVDELLNKICKVGVEHGSFLFVTIVRYNEDTNSIVPVAFSGHTDGFINSINLTSTCEQDELDPIKKTIQTGSHFICNDINSNETCTTWKDEALKLGYQSYAAFPLKVFEKNEGVIMFYSGDLNFFSEEEIHLLDELSGDVSYALENMEREKIKNQIEQQNRALEEKLIRSQKMEAIGQLSGGIAHDFNNILFSITNYIYLIHKNMDKSNPLRKYTEGIQLASEKAANLTKALLAFSRKQIIQPRAVNLNDIILQIEPILRRLITEEAEVRIELVNDTPNIMADHSQIEQVLMNLVANAKDSMQGGGILVIKTEIVQLNMPYIGNKLHDVKGAYALLTVSDTGCGMDTEVVSRIFEPFYTTKDVGKGTGLGLSTVYGIVKQHSGLINVYSEREIGTTFKIYFPLTGVEAEYVKAPERIEVKGGDETILVVEDEFEVRKIVLELLSDMGYKTMEANDGEAAVETYKRYNGKIHMVILDVIMPKRNGKQVYDEIKTIKPDVKALFMSGYPFDVLSGRGIVVENLDFISKPIAAEEFLTKVREVLDK
ncbi:MAG: ATP-binding protein [Nitrospirae bacterium YQR-1]